MMSSRVCRWVVPDRWWCDSDRHIAHHALLALASLESQVDDWRDAARFVRKPMKPQYVMTKEVLLEPRVEHPMATMHPSRERLQGR